MVLTDDEMMEVFIKATKGMHACEAQIMWDLFASRKSVDEALQILSDFKGKHGEPVKTRTIDLVGKEVDIWGWGDDVDANEFNNEN